MAKRRMPATARSRRALISESEKMKASAIYPQDDVASRIDRNVALLNYHWENVNFGAVLTAYALNRAINGLG